MSYNNLGIALVQLGQDDEAVIKYERALYFRPDYPEAHLNRSLAWLAAGDFERGWTEYEWRWMAKDVNRRAFRQRRWDGCDLHGKTIFVYLEQGVGDTLQFIRYARLLKQRGARVVVEVQKSLAKLAATCPFIDEVVKIGDPAPEFDLQVPLLSLPAIFRTTVDTIPAEVPYLVADEKLVEQWRERLDVVEASGTRQCAGSIDLAPDTGIAAEEHTSDTTGRLTPPARRPLAERKATFRVAIAWQGNPQYRGDRQRSIPLKCFAPLAAIPGVQLISIQKGHGAEQLQGPGDQKGTQVQYSDEATDTEEDAENPKSKIENPKFAVADPSPIDEQAGAFMDTAAIMKAVDLVITSDTAIPHLAGALGVEVWMALPAVADWRWMRMGEECPWYPTMRIFRQHEPNDWEELFERMAQELMTRVQGSGFGVQERQQDTRSTEDRTDNPKSKIQNPVRRNGSTRRDWPRLRQESWKRPKLR